MTSSPFDVLVRYKEVKEAHPTPPPKARTKRESSLDITPRTWNGAQFASKPAPLIPIKGHNLQQGKVLPPRTVRGVPRGKK